MSLDQIFNLTLEEKQLILDGPALAPPDGIVPNFENPSDRNDLAEITNIACLAVASVGMLLRIYAKIFCVRKLEIEDFLAIAALGTFTGCIYCSYWMMGIAGMFVNQWNVQAKQMSMILYIFHIGSNLSAVTVMVTKASILIEWNRLFVPYRVPNGFFWTNTAVLCIHTVFHMGWIITENLSCFPHRKIWDKTMAGGVCIDVKSIYIPAATLNLLSDIIILVLPQQTIWTLQMSTKNKIGISLVFTIGFLACASATAKLVATVRFNRSQDTVYTMSAMYLYTLAEITCLFLVFCVPMAPKAVMDRTLITKLGSSLSRIYHGVNDNVSLGRLYPTHSQPSAADSSVEDKDFRPKGGILRTTEFTAVVTTRNSCSDDLGTPDTHRQNHPWVGTD